MKEIFSHGNIRIQRTNDHLVVDWSHKGQRDDLIGAGWVAALTGLDAKTNFARQFLKRNFPIKVNGRVILEYRKIYGGGSKYSYDKSGGLEGFLLIDGEDVESLAKDQVAAFLMAKPELQPSASVFTHYLIFDPNNKCIACYARIKSLPELLADFVTRTKPEHPTHCMWPKTCFHPDGQQFSIEHNGWHLIVMTPQSVQSHIANNTAEGNDISAAIKALAEYEKEAAGVAAM